LARRLLDRGHAVSALGSADLADRFAAIGAPYIARDPATEWDQSVAADDVLAHSADADVFVVDYMMPAALCGAEASGRPTVALVHTLYTAMRVNGDFPTMYMAASLDAVNTARERLGLALVDGLGALLDRAALVLATSPRELDAPGELASNVRYVGPVLETVASVAVDPADIVVSLGTTPMDEAPLLERVLQAAAPLPVRVHATVGDHLDPGDVAAPDNAVVTGYVPHSALLPGARLLVCHAGLGGVLAGLSYGVPLLCIPLGRDQPANAAAVERVGAGRSLAPDASIDDLRAAIEDLLATGANDLRPAIAAYGDAAVTELESVTAG